MEREGRIGQFLWRGRRGYICGGREDRTVSVEREGRIYMWGEGDRTVSVEREGRIYMWGEGDRTVSVEREGRIYMWGGGGREIGQFLWRGRGGYICGGREDRTVSGYVCVCVWGGGGGGGGMKSS